MSFRNLYGEILTPNVMVLGDGVFGRSLGHEGESFINRISALIKRTLEILFIRIGYESLT